MPAPINPFKAALKDGRRSIGLWRGLRDAYSAEIVARAGFDWLLLDAEHSPNELASILAQLPVIERHATPVLRLPENAAWMVKQALDAGVQTLLAPMVHDADTARAMVRAMRYPPEGIRGVGHALGRASGFGAEPDYQATANAQMCLIVQIESRAALDNLDAILAVEGVDAAFIGPADLAADLGLPFDGPEMRKILADTLRRIAAAGVPAGTLDAPDAAGGHFEAGAQFVAVGADTVILSRTLRTLAAEMKAAHAHGS